MELAELVKTGVIVSGAGLILLSFWLHCEKKLTINFAVVWMLLGILLIVSGVLPAPAFWLRLLSSELAVPFLGLGICCMVGGLVSSLLLSQMAMKNRILAMQVSLLLEENRNMLASAEEAEGKHETSAAGY